MKKNLDEHVSELKAWAVEDEEKRGFIILAIEDVNQTDTGHEVACTAGVFGSDMLITSSLAEAFDDEENPVGKAIKKAIMYQATKKIMSSLSESHKDKAEENVEHEVDKYVN